MIEEALPSGSVRAALINTLYVWFPASWAPMDSAANIEHRHDSRAWQ